MRIAIQGGLLVDPKTGTEKKQNVYINKGIIEAIGKEPAWTNKKVTNIDATDLIVSPGFVDLRARMREPGHEHKATLATETRAAVLAGITSLCMPPDCIPAIDTPAIAQMIRQRANELGGAKVYPIAALTHGLQGSVLTDMKALVDAGCVGVSNALAPLDNTLVMRRALQYATTFDVLALIYPQNASLRGNGVAHEGRVSTRLGLPASPVAAEIVGLARDLALVETTGARAHFCGISSARAVEMIQEARVRGLSVTADVTIAHLHLTEDSLLSFDTNCHVEPPFRSEQDRQALVAAVVDGTITAICTDHQPHEPEAKLTPFSESEPGTSSLEVLLPLALATGKQTQMSLATTISMLTYGPARVLNIEAGEISVGQRADVCIFDRDEQWVLDENSINSAGKNSPFLGDTLTGKIKQVICEGKLITI
ncbi:MAG: dihydroorotase [Proteobacteria bacterium]|mgnify:CR=1 FL=1|jgi:dihydroorotase|nr:dihydroorotase [Pseudomonadota bacterium]